MTCYRIVLAEKARTPVSMAVTERAATQRLLAEAVATARNAGVSWSAIGGMLGTSGEAARKRYGGHNVKSA